MRLRTGTLLALTLALCFAAPARAKLTLSFEDATITQGGNTTLDVWVYDPDGNGIEMTGYNFDFRIERSTGAGDLQFVDPQILSYRTDGNNYVFGTDVFSAISEVAPVSGGTPSANGLNRRYFGDASMTSFGEVTVNASMLLARLQLTAAPIGGTVPDVGSTFKVFFVPNAGPYDYSDGTSDYFGNTSFGTVTVQAVPEPAAILSVLSGLAIVLVGQGWRRRRNRNDKDLTVA